MARFFVDGYTRGVQFMTPIGTFINGQEHSGDGAVAWLRAQGYGISQTFNHDRARGNVASAARGDAPTHDHP